MKKKFYVLLVLLLLVGLSAPGQAKLRSDLAERVDGFTMSASGEEMGLYVSNPVQITQSFMVYENDVLVIENEVQTYIDHRQLVTGQYDYFLVSQVLADIQAEYGPGVVFTKLEPVLAPKVTIATITDRWVSNTLSNGDTEFTIEVHYTTHWTRDEDGWLVNRINIDQIMDGYTNRWWKPNPAQ